MFVFNDNFPSVSFWPALSVALSFFSIIINSARTINLFDTGLKQASIDAIQLPVSPI
jgi:hypothetical protein